MSYCWRCGNEVDTAGSSNLCGSCKFNYLSQPIPKFNYCCPRCGGCFNEPARQAVSSNTGPGMCPFCGKEMAI